MPWEMNNQEKIEAAGRKKEEGNLLFKNGKYELAKNIIRWLNALV